MRGRMGGMLGVSPAHIPIVCVIVVALLWKRMPPFAWRFTKQDVLIITTALAVAMGFMAYIVRR